MQYVPLRENIFAAGPRCEGIASAKPLGSNMYKKPSDTTDTKSLIEKQLSNPSP